MLGISHRFFGISGPSVTAPYGLPARHEDFITALEASTVIENLHGNIPEEKIHIAIQRLKSESNEDNAFLLEGTIPHLEEMLLKEEEDEEEHHHDHGHDCSCHCHD